MHGRSDPLFLAVHQAQKELAAACGTCPGGPLRARLQAALDILNSVLVASQSHHLCGQPESAPVRRPPAWTNLREVGLSVARQLIARRLHLCSLHHALPDAFVLAPSNVVEQLIQEMLGEILDYCRGRDQLSLTSCRDGDFVYLIAVLHGAGQPPEGKHWSVADIVPLDFSQSRSHSGLRLFTTQRLAQTYQGLLARFPNPGSVRNHLILRLPLAAP